MRKARLFGDYKKTGSFELVTWHCFGQSGDGEESFPCAVVENEDGTVIVVDADRIQFVDPPEIIPTCPDDTPIDVNLLSLYHMGWRGIETAPKDGTIIEFLNVTNGLHDVGNWDRGKWATDCGCGEMTHWRLVSDNQGKRCKNEGPA